MPEDADPEPEVSVTVTVDQDYNDITVTVEIDQASADRASWTSNVVLCEADFYNVPHFPELEGRIGQISRDVGRGQSNFTQHCGLRVAPGEVGRWTIGASVCVGGGRKTIAFSEPFETT